MLNPTILSGTAWIRWIWIINRTLIRWGRGIWRWTGGIWWRRRWWGGRIWWWWNTWIFWWSSLSFRFLILKNQMIVMHPCNSIEYDAKWLSTSSRKTKNQDTVKQHEPFHGFKLKQHTALVLHIKSVTKNFLTSFTSIDNCRFFACLIFLFNSVDLDVRWTYLREFLHSYVQWPFCKHFWHVTFCCKRDVAISRDWFQQ